MPLLEDLLVEELKDLLSAEAQLIKAMPKMAKSASNPKLKQAFQKHLEETKGQVERLKTAFEILGQKAKAKHCKGMEGLITEGLESLEETKEKGDAAVDLILVLSAQKIEHYEISGYGSCRTMAEQLGNKKVARLLQQTLTEEEKTDKILTQLSPPVLKQAAQEEEPEQED
jgi:ferritin-like metal-binding protein YciE